MSWEKINKPGQFPNVNVYKREGMNGAAVYSIAFCNPEFALGWRGSLAGTGLIVGLLGFFPMFFSVGPMLGFIPVLIWTVAVIGYAWYVWEPWEIRRNIELDYGEDVFRSLRQGKVELERRLEWLHNLTVKDHPDAEYERMRRQEKGEKPLTKTERQHCLIGWFGEGGAEQVILCFRAEWPTRHSLMEVQQAVLWARQQAAGPGAKLVREGNMGINPDLD